MAIITHRTSKNARYADVLEYYTYKHEEDPQTGHYEPILDENGWMQERDNYAVCYITAKGEEAEPELWAAACMQTNIHFRKNMAEGDRKNHEYILSFPAEDRERMSTEDLMEIGKKCARENFPGSDCLIAVHRDTDNDHIHITLNSVRAEQREEQSWMMKRNGQTLACEMAAGGKHQDSPQLRRHLNDWVLEECRQHGWTEKDNNAIADAHRAQRHGTKNEQMKAALLEAAGRSKDLKELQRIMREDYRMELKIRNNTFSVQHPDSQKAVRLRTLGLEPADLTRRLDGEQYTYTKEAEEEQRRKMMEAAEKKKYIEWMKSLRQRNDEKAEDAIVKTEKILAEQLRARGERYSRDEFRDLNYLLKQTAYLASDLETEKARLDRLLERWEKYQDPALSEQERRQHGGYLKWCGCNPAEGLELEDLKAEREIIEAQQMQAAAMRNALLDTSEQWKGRNELTYSENDLAWTKNREAQLKQQLKRIKENRKRLAEIVGNCEKAAKRRVSARTAEMVYEKFGEWPVQWRNYVKYKAAYEDKVLQQEKIEAKLQEIRSKKKDAKTNVRQAKKRAKELQI